MSLRRDEGCIYLCFLLRPVGFCFSKILHLCHLGVTKSACPTAAKKRLLPHSAAPQSMPPPLFRVSRKQRYNTLDFAAQNRVPTGMLRAPIGNPAAKGCSLCNPSFPSQVYVQTAKGSLQCLLRKCKRKPAQVRGTDFLLDGNAEEREAFSSAFPRSARRGRVGNERGENSI